MFSAGENILGKKYQVFRPLAGKWVSNGNGTFKIYSDVVSVPLRGSGFQTLVLTARCLCGFQNPFAAENALSRSPADPKVKNSPQSLILCGVAED